MLMNYKQCVEAFGSKYYVKEVLESGKLHRIEEGIYSYEKYVPELAVISKKYPKAVFTLGSAFYYHNLTDTIPTHYHLATGRGAAKISDPRIVQTFENSDTLYLGAEPAERDGTIIQMYNRERMLVELLRNKNKLPFDYYKEVLLNYRKILDSLDIPLLQDYAMQLPKSGMIMEALQLEVF